MSKKIKPTTAIHGSATAHDGTSHHVVGIGNLRVVIAQEDGAWFAQGLEIDYAAQGASLHDVKDRFEHGLKATIKEYLRVYGDIERILQPASEGIWHDLYKARHYQFSQISIHHFPYSGIDYYQAA